MTMAYVHVPDLLIQVERRRRPELRGRAIVVLETSGGRQVVEAASAEARALGVARGQTGRQAEHCCPEAAVVAADWAAYEAAFGALLAALGRVSPIVQPHRASWGAEVNVSGLELLFGPDRIVAAELIRRAGRAGLRARVGLGPNRLVARLASGLAEPGGSLVVAPSEARAFLEPLPLEHLPLGEESRERLELLGVRTLGHLLRLPRAGLSLQVGPDALALARAVDADGEMLAPHRPAEWLAAGAEVDGPLETREQLARVLRPLVEGLVEQLRERYLGAGVVRLRFGCAPSSLVRLPASTASPAAIIDAALRLAAADTSQHTPPLPLDRLELALGDLGPLTARQAGLFEKQRLRRTQAGLAVEKLAERFHGRLRAPAFGRPA